MDPQVMAMGLGVLMGGVARLSMLKVDYRQYPSYPQAYAIHLTFGVIAAFLGAVALPAILTKEYTAATFLALAATQFREVRNTERETLTNIESTELVARGPAYIEGIARVFEARNYLAMVTAITATSSFLAAHALFDNLWAAISTGIIVAITTILLLSRSMRGQVVKDLAGIRPAEITFDGPIIVVGENRLINIGAKRAQEEYKKHGMAVIIEPANPNAKATLANTGQRQAIAHNASALLGIRKDVDTPQFTPIVRRNIDTGELILIIVPGEPSMDALIQAVGETPVLEGAVRKPLEARAARMVD